MRSCIYCGRELEKGEVCDCPQSVAHRAGKQQSSAERKTKQNRRQKSDKNKRKHRLITVIRIKPKLLTKQVMPERKASLKGRR